MCITSVLMGVYEHVSRPRATMVGWEAIQTRWIDIIKGDDENPISGAAWWAKSSENEHMDGLFAETPPLDAFWFLAHKAATVRTDENRGSKG